MEINMTIATNIPGENYTSTPVYDLEEEASKYTAYRIGIGLHIYLTPVIFFLGIVFNIISLCVMLQAPNRKISCCIYLAALAITDNLVLYCAAHYWFSTVVFKGTTLAMTPEICEIMSGIVQMFSVSSTYLIAAVTLDRFLATCYPFTTTFWRTPKRAYIIIIMVVISCILLNIPMMKSAVLVDAYTCITLGSGGDSAKTVAIISTLLFAILPSIAILTLNCALVHSVKKRGQTVLRRYGVGARSESDVSRNLQILSVSELTSSYSSTGTDNTEQRHGSEHEGELPTRSDIDDSTGPSTPPTVTHGERRAPVRDLFHRIRRRRTNSQTDSSNSSALNRQLSKMLLTVSFTFLVLTLPQYIRYILLGYVDFRNNIEHYAIYVLVVNITNKLLNTKSAINFVLYCISGRRFRKHLRLMIESKRCCI